MVPTKMVQISFCVFLMIWLEIFLFDLEQLLQSPYVYKVYLVDLLACLTKDQPSTYVQKLPLKTYFQSLDSRRNSVLSV